MELDALEASQRDAIEETDRDQFEASQLFAECPLVAIDRDFLLGALEHIPRPGNSLKLEDLPEELVTCLAVRVYEHQENIPDFFTWLGVSYVALPLQALMNWQSHETGRRVLQEYVYCLTIQVLELGT